MRELGNGRQELSDAWLTSNRIFGEELTHSPNMRSAKLLSAHTH